MNAIQKIKIALVDDNELFREGIKRILTSTNQFEVVFVGGSVTELIENAPFEIDIIIFDQMVFESNCLNRINHLLDKFPGANLAIFISDIRSYQMKKSIDMELLGYLTKEIEISSLVSALQTVYRKEYWVSPDLSHYLISTYKELESEHKESDQKEQVVRPLHLLSVRECEVLHLLGNGYNNQAIANALGVTQSTVKNHVTNIFVKMNVNDRTQAVIKAIKNKWIDINDERVNIM